MIIELRALDYIGTSSELQLLVYQSDCSIRVFGLFYIYTNFEVLSHTASDVQAFQFYIGAPEGFLCHFTIWFLVLY